MGYAEARTVAASKRETIYEDFARNSHWEWKAESRRRQSKCSSPYNKPPAKIGFHFIICPICLFKLLTLSALLFLSAMNPRWRSVIFTLTHFYVNRFPTSYPVIKIRAILSSTFQIDRLVAQEAFWVSHKGSVTIYSNGDAPLARVVQQWDGSVSVRECGCTVLEINIHFKRKSSPYSYDFRDKRLICVRVI